MRRTAILTTRLLILAALVAAVVDVRLPAESQARHRIHLIDRSASTLVAGPAESLTAEDARKVVEWSRAGLEPGDTLLWASFASDVAFESDAIDPSATDLEAAIKKALARNPTEIVIHTDGRTDPGDALFLCRQRKIPVHVFPLGPTEVRDVRIDRVRAPARAAPGEGVTIDVAVESTYEGAVTLTLGNTARDIQVGPGAPTQVSFNRTGPGSFTVALDVEDACAENNAADILIDERSEQPRVLLLSAAARQIPGYSVRTTPAFENPNPYAAVIVDNVELTPQQHGRLADYVQGLGGGLLLAGGRNSYALGEWKGTRLESLSPLLATPPHRVAFVFGIDASGSMADPPEKLRDVLAAVRDAWNRLDKEVDDVRALHVPGKLEGNTWRAIMLTRSEQLRSIRPAGPTVFEDAIHQARIYLQRFRGRRRHLILFTDGEAAEQEKPEDRRRAERLLKGDGVGLTVVTTNRKLDVGDNIAIDDWASLSRKIDSILDGLRETEAENPGPLDLADHVTTRNVPRVDLPFMNLTRERQGVEVVGTVGRASKNYPAVAFHSSGRGRVGAFTFELEAAPAPLLEQTVKYVAGESSGGLTLEIDYPVVRARGDGPPRLEVSYSAAGGQSGTIQLDQVRKDLWEGSLPEIGRGTVFVGLGDARASATLPTSPEFSALGVDGDALRRIAVETGGRLLRSPQALAALPRPERPEKISGRAFFVFAALLLIFLELALSTFWKEKGAETPRS